MGINEGQHRYDFTVLRAFSDGAANRIRMHSKVVLELMNRVYLNTGAALQRCL